MKHENRFLFNPLIVMGFVLVLINSCKKGDESSSGTKLRILPGYNLSACIDIYTGKSYVTPEMLMAAGGAPSLGIGYKWSPPSLSTFPMGTAVYNGVFKSNGGALVAGQHSFKIEVSDGPGGTTATATVTLSVTTVSSAPSGGVPGVGCPWAVLQQYPSSSFALDDANASKSYGASLFAMGGTPPYSWSLDISSGLSVLPSGLTIDPINGIVYGTPFPSSSGKTFKFSVIVKDSAGSTVSGPVYTITVK